MAEKKILIVEADAEVAKQIATTCRDFNFKVGVLQDAEDLIEFLEEDPPHLLVLSGDLPDQDGIQVCSAIRGRPALKKVAVILSGHVNRQADFEAHRNLKEAADAYFLKPIDTADLLDQIERLIGLPPRPSSPKKEKPNTPGAEREPSGLGVQEKDREIAMLKESYVSMDQKLNQARQEAASYQEDLRKMEKRFMDLEREHQAELDQIAMSKDRVKGEGEKKVDQLERENLALQREIESLMAKVDAGKKEVEQGQRRTHLLEEENFKRESLLKDRIKDLLNEIDESKQAKDQALQQMEEIKAYYENEFNRIQGEFQGIEQEKQKMEQRVVKAYKKIKLDQVRDEKIKKAIDIALQLIQGREE